MYISVPATSANMGAGFDSLGVALKLYNHIEITRSRFFSIALHGEGAHFLKTKKGNIFLNIFDKTYEELTGRREAFRFKFENNIPLSRGLGSSSAVIVSAITAARAMARLPFDRAAIISRALTYEHHPDNITPATYGGFCVCAVEQERVWHIKTALEAKLRAVIVIPNKPISTRHSRNALPKRMPTEDAAFNISRSSLLTAALITRNYDYLRVASQDKLHQMIRMRFLPQLFEVQKTALDSGALMSTLSGSGSSFFSLASDQDAAEKIARALAAQFPSFRVEIVEFDTQGVHSKE